MKMNVSPEQLAAVLSEVDNTVAEHAPPDALAEYDASPLEELSRRLLEEAATIVLWGGIRGFALGLILSAGAFGVWNFVPLIPGKYLALGCAVLIAVLSERAFSAAQERAFHLRVEAQTILCQVQIEKSTRAIARALSGR